MLRELAELRGSSISALIREGVDVLLDPLRRDRREVWAKAEAAIGRYRSGKRDIAENHDDEFADAIARVPGGAQE